MNFKEDSDNNSMRRTFLVNKPEMKKEKKEGRENFIKNVREKVLT